MTETRTSTSPTGEVGTKELSKILRGAGLRLSQPVQRVGGGALFTARRTFLKRPKDCKTSDDFAKAVITALTEAGFEVDMKHWQVSVRPSPQESFFKVRFTAHRKEGHGK